MYFPHEISLLASLIVFHASPIPSFLCSEYWLGLQRMHDITKNGRWYLRIEVKYDLDWHDKPSSRQGQTGVGVWESFFVASEEEEFKLSIGNLIEKENVGDRDPMRHSDGMKFSTEDNDNDNWYDDCAAYHGGGWWHNACYDFCGTCRRDLPDAGIWYDWTGQEKPSKSSMWIKQEIDN